MKAHFFSSKINLSANRKSEQLRLQTIPIVEKEHHSTANFNEQNENVFGTHTKASDNIIGRKTTASLLKSKPLELTPIQSQKSIEVRDEQRDDFEKIDVKKYETQRDLLEGGVSDPHESEEMEGGSEAEKKIGDIGKQNSSSEEEQDEQEIEEDSDDENGFIVQHFYVDFRHTFLQGNLQNILGKPRYQVINEANNASTLRQIVLRRFYENEGF